MHRCSRRILPVLLALFGIFSVSAQAQGRATIFGDVTDVSGAAIPGASVIATNIATQQTQKTVTSSSGSYVFPSIEPGSYSLKVIATGFETSVTGKILIQVNENRNVSPRLQIGSVTSEVNVTESVAQVDTRTATLTQVIDAQRVKDLPLNGRNPLDLQSLVPGAGGQTNLTGQQQNALMSINGNRWNENNYTLDGVDNEDPFFNSPSVVPNPDALDQFSIETSNYGAQEGRGSGAQINALIKSGTNQIHGSLFEYIRNPVFDAKPYFSTLIAPYRRHQFGGSIGGPIVHDKLFYFFSFQRTQTHASPNSVTLTLPTAAELTGDFSDLCPAGFLTTGSKAGTCSSTATPNKQLTIPGTKTPAPNNNLTPYIYAPTLKFMADFVPAANNGPTSYIFTPPNTTTENQYIGRMDYTIGPRDTIYGHILNVGNKNASTTQALNLPGFYANTDYTNWHIALNETHTFSARLLNVATFGYLDIARVQTPHVPEKVTWADFGAGIVRAVPTADIGWDTRVATYFSAFSAWDLEQYRKEFQYSDFLSWTVGDHSFSFGGDLRQGYTRQGQNFQTDGQFQFAASYTGNQFADFLTGHPNQIMQKSPNEGRPHNIVPDAFAQDDWKVTRRLTLNLGLRWEPFIPYKDELGRLAQFRPGQQSTVFPMAPAGYVFPGDSGVSASTYSAKWGEFSPRVGFALDVFGDGNTSLRGGAGVYYSTLRTQSFNSESLNQPYAIALTLSKPSGGMAQPYKDVGGSPYPFTPPDPADAASYTFTTPLSTLSDFDPNFRNSRTDQWNLNLQQRFKSSIVTTVAYVGSVGEHLFLTYEADPGVYSKGGVRLYAPIFSSIQRFASGGHSSYHALQGTLNKRLSQGITLLASYTWSKSLDNNTQENTAVANPFNLAANRGLSDADIRNSFAMSGIWHLPSPRHENVLLKLVAKDWEINGIWLAQSGNPFSVNSGVDNSESGVNSDYADVVGRPLTYPHAPRAQQINGYFNTSVYTLNAPGTFGNSGRNSLIGPGLDRVTLGMQKSLVSTERFKVLFRAEAFNVFNHPSLSNPAANVSSTATFGKITAAGDPRVGQAALRIEF